MKLSEINDKIHELLNSIKDINTNLDTIFNRKPIRVLEDYGTVNDTDNGALLLKAMNSCAKNGYILCLNKKYKIASNVVYNASSPLVIIGDKGNYPNLVKNINSYDNESCNLYLEDGVTIEINSLGSTTWFGVGISGASKTSNSGFLIKSFHNKFINCSFAQLGKAIYHTSGANNWLGENQYLYNNFSKCQYCFYADDGSDSEFIGNNINSFCDYGFYGQCAGFTFSENHFYNKLENTFNYFNTKIVNNYFQNFMENPSIKLDGSFGCLVSNNQFELSSSDDLTSKKHIINIVLNSGKGNINISNNNVHGKNLHKVANLSFIGFTYTTKYDMPLTVSNNNVDCCEKIFEESYPAYNVYGLSYCGVPTSSNCTIDSSVSKYYISDGICHFYAKVISTPTSDCILQFPLPSIPFVCNVTTTWSTGGGKSKSVLPIKTDGQLVFLDYATVKEMEIYATYAINQRNTMTRS